MSKETILDKIKELSINRLTLFESDKYNSGRDMVLLPLDSYKEAMDLILHLLKTCILALQADYVPDKYIGEPSFNISEILKLIVDIVPYEEMEFLDEIGTLIESFELGK